MSGVESFRKEPRPVSGLDARIALHPWDEETFGFTTGEVEVGGGLSDGEPLLRWMSDEDVALLVTTVGAEDSLERHRLQRLGFFPVEETYAVALPRLARTDLPPASVGLRLAEAGDVTRIRELARRAFHFGRFFTDPLFPRHLARERMADWIGRAVASQDSADVVLVQDPMSTEEHGGDSESLRGFFHVRTDGRRAQLQLGAVDPERNEGLGGVGLFVETLRWLRDQDVRSVHAEIAAANTAVVNIYARLGFHFTRLDITMHLHSPLAPYLRG